MEKLDKIVQREEHHILKKFTGKLVPLDGLEKVANNNGKYMATINSVMSIIHGFHSETGHGGEKKTYQAVSNQYSNIPCSLIQQYIRQWERCTEKRH